MHLFTIYLSICLIFVYVFYFDYCFLKSFLICTVFVRCKTCLLRLSSHSNEEDDNKFVCFSFDYFFLLLRKVLKLSVA